MTLDYEDDFKFFSEIIENLDLDFNLKNVLTYIENNPNIKKINYHLEEKWKENQNK